MDTFMGRYRNATIFGAAIILQVLGLAIQIKRPISSDDNSSSSSRLIRLWAVTIVAPLEKGIVRVQTSTAGVWHNYFYLRGVRQENRDLKDQIEQLRLEQVRLKQDADQAHRLQALLGFKEQFIGETKAAQVIGSSGSEHSRLVYIDKGSDDGLRPEMPVITPDGVVGKVLNVIDGSTSQVLLINDQQSGVGAIIEQSRLQGVLKGRASGELVIDKIMTDEEIKPGDRILTSGGDRIFPKGLPVGTVAKVAKGAEFIQLTVKPAAMLNHLEEVLVITKKEQHEVPALTPAPTRAADILAQRLPQVPDKPATPASTAPGGASALAKTANPGTAAAGSTPATGTTTGTVPASAAPIKKPAIAGEPGTATNSALSSSNSATPTAPAAVPPKPANFGSTTAAGGTGSLANSAPGLSTISKPTAPAVAPPKPATKPEQPGGAKPPNTAKPAVSDPNPSQDTPQ